MINKFTKELYINIAIVFYAINNLGAVKNCESTKEPWEKSLNTSGLYVIVNVCNQVKAIS